MSIATKPEFLGINRLKSRVSGLLARLISVEEAETESVLIV
jgi:hypothetical protein